MKIVFVLSLLVALAVSYEKMAEECSKETGLDQSDVQEYLLGDDAENDAKATKFLMCIFKKEEALDDDGQLDVEKAKLAIKEYMKDVDASDEEALECAQQKDTPEETALALAKCVEKRKAELSSSK